MKNREKLNFSGFFATKFQVTLFLNVEKQKAGQQIREDVENNFLKLSFQFEIAILDKKKIVKQNKA